MKEKDFTEKEIVQALKQCVKPRGQRCAIFGKGYQGICTAMIMKRADEIIEKKEEGRNENESKG